MSVQLKDDISRLEQKLDSLSFNNLPVTGLTKWFYVRGLTDKAIKNQHRHPLATKLINKAYKALSELEASLERQRNEAQEQLTIIEEEYDDAYDEATSLFESRSYFTLKKLYGTVQHKDADGFFKELINELTKDALSLTATDQTEKISHNRSNKIKHNELQSFQQYQSVFEKMALDRLLAKVMKEIPENAGPLNPERLVIRAFKALQYISPEYLSRLISYYESLLTLQLLNNSDK